MLKLQDKIKSLILRLKSQEHQDISSLQKIVEKSTLQIEALELEKLQLGKQCRNYELEKNREILFAKHQVQKFTQNLVSSKDEVSKLQIRLKVIKLSDYRSASGRLIL
jgi:predicted RNase H-like nuclease (RuvC/YqgF family)